jgi:5'-nucleotidase
VKALPLTIAVDVDEVCADLLGEWLRRYNVDYGDNLTVDDATDWDLTKVVKPECGQDIYRYLHEGIIYSNVLPIPGARPAVYELLSMGHRVVYATACKGLHSAQRKQEWLLRWGFLTEKNVYRDFIPITDKSLVRADILFDDRWENVSSFKGCGVLVTRKHNLLAPAWHRIGRMEFAPTWVQGFQKSYEF